MGASDDDLLFAEDYELLFAANDELHIASAPRDDDPAPEAWKVLLVDDERDMHSVTKMAFSGMLIDSRPVEIVSAYSKAEAEQMLAIHNDIALAILDVVMEGDDSGLLIAEHIRRNYADKSIRIVLRTGQPGLAPEERILRDYDINDYWSKTELTAKRMRTLVTGIIRSYRDLRLLQRYSRQLEQQNLELQTLKDDLERLVEERTLELLRAKQQLEDINSQLARKNADLSDTATRDSLTGLINHGNFASRVDLMLAGHRDELVALIMLDIDHFKRFNDENGHPAGDAAICAVARLLDKGIRGNDFAARVGGEEFALVLQDCNLQKAVGVADRLRREIAQIRIDGAFQRGITASLGVSVSKEGEQRDTLVQRSDQALYTSKRRGRNCVTSEDELCP